MLEHLADPHEAVRWVGKHSPWLVCSSPHDEHPGSYDECHAWAWDVDGYARLVEQGGYRVVRHEVVDRFQVVLAAR